MQLRFLGAAGTVTGSYVPETMPRGRQFSEEVARDIDRAVKAIIDAAFGKARQVLSQNRTALERGAALLLQKETLNEDDLQTITRADAPFPAVERAEPAAQTQAA